MRVEADLDDLRRHAFAWSVVSAWSRLGLFDLLADGQPRSSAEFGVSERGIDLTAPVLGHIGILVAGTRGGAPTWTLSSSARRMYAEGGLSLGFQADQMRDLAALDERIRDGTPATASRALNDEPAALRRFHDMLYRRSAETAATTADAVRERLPNGGRAMDLGGGHGRYAAELAARGFDTTLLDVPAVIALARERHGDSVRYLEADFHTDPLGGPWDVVVASNVCHLLSADALAALLRRLRPAIRPGGLLALKDMFVDDTAVGPDVAVLFGIVMLLHTPGGRSHRTDDLRHLLADAGFARVDHVHQVDQAYSLVFAS